MSNVKSQVTKNLHNSCTLWYYNQLFWPFNCVGCSFQMQQDTFFFLFKNNKLNTETEKGKLEVN